MSILDIKMQENDADAKTIREYLKQLLKTLWSEGESFSGKHAFGNSGWEYELYEALVVAGVCDGYIDEEYGGLLDFDQKAANKLIFKAIAELN